jgi:hypothetical protein
VKRSQPVKVAHRVSVMDCSADGEGADLWQFRCSCGTSGEWLGDRLSAEDQAGRHLTLRLAA